MKIDREFSNLIPPLSEEEKKKLKESIKLEGVREPLVLWKGILIDGHNRKELADKLNIKYKTTKKKFKDKNEALLWIINNQLGRRNISSYDKIILFKKALKILQPQAEANMKSGTTLSLFKERVHIDKEISKLSKIGHDTISKVIFIEKNAKPEQKKRLSTQQDSINKVYHEIKKQIVLKEKVKVINLPKEEFNIILADPPWRYNFSQTNERSIETHYSSMSLKQIKKIKVPTSQNSILFLWVTAPKLQEALEVLESWGFEYKTCAIWDKEIIGMGYWFRGQHEILLVGTKGKVKVPEPKNRFSSVIKSRRNKHSKKPKEVYEMIEIMFPNQRYLELFAREKRNGWNSWGNEIK